MKQGNKQQNGKKKAKLQPKSKIKYRNLKSNYSLLEDGDFEINGKQKRKQNIKEEEEEDDVKTSLKPQKNRQRTENNYQDIDDDDLDY